MKKLKYILIGLLIQLLPIIIIITVIGGMFSFDNQSPYTMAVAEGDVYWDKEHPIENSVTAAILVYIESTEDFQKLKKEVLDPMIENEKDIEVPLNYLIIPSLLSGNISPSKDFISKLIYQMKNEKTVENEVTDIKTGRIKTTKTVIYNLEPVEKYVSNLYKMEEFKSLKEVISEKTTVGYIKAFDNISITKFLSSDILKNFKGDMIYPFTSYQPVSALIGWYAPFGTKIKHNGVDFAAGCGTPVYNIADGVVYSISGNKPDSRSGYFVRIRNNNDLTISYLHFEFKPEFNVGDFIEKGRYVGSVGTTGLSTGCHLHLEIRTQNNEPVSFCDFIDCYNKNINN